MLNRKKKCVMMKQKGNKYWLWIVFVDSIELSQLDDLQYLSVFETFVTQDFGLSQSNGKIIQTFHFNVLQNFWLSI